MLDIQAVLEDFHPSVQNPEDILIPPNPIVAMILHPYRRALRGRLQQNLGHPSPTLDSKSDKTDPTQSRIRDFANS